MKKQSVSIKTALLLSSSLSSPLLAASESEPIVLGSAKTTEAAKDGILLARLEEINTMDKSTMTKPEKNNCEKKYTLSTRVIGSSTEGYMYLPPPLSSLLFY